MARRSVFTLLVLTGVLAGLDVARAEGVSSADLLRHRQGLWALEPVGTTQRWVEIHNLAGADEHTVLHIEVLAREAGAPAWQLTHLAPHMAITVDALRRSVRKPLLHGSVYPETFDYAFAQWTRDQQAGHAPICTTSVDQCLRGTGEATAPRLLLPQVRLLNYYPAANGWTYMWDRFDPHAIDQDFGRIAGLKFNTVRVSILVSFFALPTPTSTASSRLAQVVDLAERHGLAVQFNLFDWMPDFTAVEASRRWVDAVVRPYRNDPRIAFIDVHNELGVRLAPRRHLGMDSAFRNSNIARDC